MQRKLRSSGGGHRTHTHDPQNSNECCALFSGEGTAGSRFGIGESCDAGLGLDRFNRELARGMNCSRKRDAGGQGDGEKLFTLLGREETAPGGGDV